MKIELIKNLKRESGKILPKGLIFTVTNEYGQELIKKGMAVKEGDSVPQEINKKDNK